MPKGLCALPLGRVLLLVSPLCKPQILHSYLDLGAGMSAGQLWSGPVYIEGRSPMLAQGACCESLRLHTHLRLPSLYLVLLIWKMGWD